MSSAASQVDDKGAAHSQAVKAMFSGIASRYDLLNHVLSLNIDKTWRRKVAERLRPVLNDADAVVLDVACGTGDLALELKRDSKATIIGTDFCRPMLAIADAKTRSNGAAVTYVEGDAMSLAFADATFDAVTIAFGLRNLPSFGNGLRELLRVLKPGGRVVVLECSHPPVPGFRQLYHFYFGRVLPRIGGLVSGSPAAYRYLPDSVSSFPHQQELVRLMENTGFSDVGYTNLTGSIAALHWGMKGDCSLAAQQID
jgi:demethylmenaquinone methyltransferase/2-methoxy-6-polyprenyl-1,4-benzoquinol methylase